MHPSEVAAFERRSEEQPEVYSHERANAKLDDEYEKRFRANERPGSSGKHNPRLPQNRDVVGHQCQAGSHARSPARSLIEVSAGGRRIDQLSPPTKQKR